MKDLFDVALKGFKFFILPFFLLVAIGWVLQTYTPLKEYAFPVVIGVVALVLIWLFAKWVGAWFFLGSLGVVLLLFTGLYLNQLYQSTSLIGQMGQIEPKTFASLMLKIGKDPSTPKPNPKDPSARKYIEDLVKDQTYLREGYPSTTDGKKEPTHQQCVMMQSNAIIANDGDKLQVWIDLCYSTWRKYQNTFWNVIKIDQFELFPWLAGVSAFFGILGTFFALKMEGIGKFTGAPFWGFAFILYLTVFELPTGTIVENAAWTMFWQIFWIRLIESPIPFIAIFITIMGDEWKNAWKNRKIIVWFPKLIIPVVVSILGVSFLDQYFQAALTSEAVRTTQGLITLQQAVKLFYVDSLTWQFFPLLVGSLLSMAKGMMAAPKNLMK